MRYRQIHLDFHTSPAISDVGTSFDAEEFVQTLKKAHVNSINIFAKCHHGMCYYPTKVGRMHPALQFDLMGQMITVLHKNDIRCPLYFPIGWEEDAAERTEWLEMGKDGIPGHKKPGDASYYSWRKLCLNNPEYKAYIKKQLTELVENYEVDGFWFDIIFQQKCICRECTKEMLSMSWDPGSEKDVLRHDDYVLEKFQKEMNAFVDSFHKNIPTFYNSSWIPNSGADELAIEHRSKLQDHMEIESLPSGEWGYNHFPYFVNYHNRHNDDVIGMNGKFHLSWGDHGSLKNREALEYECFRMIANGAACSVGDQLHPRGRMNLPAYARIGEVYAEVEQMEPYLENSAKVADIGVFVSTDFYTRETASDEGVMRMLMELHIPFDFIPVTEDIGRYPLVILPDHVPMDEAFVAKLKTYLENGGKVLATYRSADESFGVKYLEDNPYEPAYMVIPPKNAVGVNRGDIENACLESIIPGIEPLEYVCYRRGARVSSELPVVSYIGDPYYNRTAECFSSHRHFPFDKVSEYPAILLGEQVGYCAFPLFSDYMENGNRVYRDVATYLIHELLKEPSVRIGNAPTCLEVTARTQPGRFLVHGISYIPERRTRTIDIVDTKLPLDGVAISVKGAYRKARAVRTGKDLPVSCRDGYSTVTVSIDGYECVAFEK